MHDFQASLDSLSLAASGQKPFIKILFELFSEYPLLTIGVIAAVAATIIPGYLYLQKLDKTGKEQQAAKIRFGLKIGGVIFAALGLLALYLWVQTMV